MNSSTSSDAAAAVAGAIWTLFSTMCCFAYLIPIGLGVLGMILWIFTLIDVAQRKEYEFPNAAKGTPSGNEQLIWLLVVVLTGVIGAIIYYFVVMRPHPRAKATPPTVEWIAPAPPVEPALPEPPVDTTPPVEG